MGDNYDSILIVILMYPRNIANMASLWYPGRIAYDELLF